MGKRVCAFYWRKDYNGRSIDHGAVEAAKSPHCAAAVISH
jgi:hypothetical protein